MVFDIIKLLPTLMALAPEVKKWIDIGLPLVQEFKKTQPNIIPVLEQIGSSLFPTLKDTIHTVAAAADTLFNPNGTIWVQRSLNTLTSAGLTEDGVYGTATKAAVLKFQTANQPGAGPMDGWAGPLTKKVILEQINKK